MHCHLPLSLLIACGLLSWGPSASARSPEACYKVLLDHHAAQVKIVKKHTAKPKCGNTLIKLNAFSNRNQSKVVSAKRCIKQNMQHMPDAKKVKFFQKVIDDSSQADRKKRKALKAFKKTCPLQHTRVDKFITSPGYLK